MAKKPETVFREGQVIPFLKTLQNTIFFPIQQMSILGDPDFMLCIRGLFVALELKDTKGALSKMQEYKLGEIDRTGGVALVADPRNWPEVREILANLDHGETHD